MCCVCRPAETEGSAKTAGRFTACRLDEIAERNGTNVEQLLRLNPNLLPSDFVSGQVICLPTRRRVTEENTEEQET